MVLGGIVTLSLVRRHAGGALWLIVRAGSRVIVAALNGRALPFRSGRTDERNCRARRRRNCCGRGPIPHGRGLRRPDQPAPDASPGSIRGRASGGTSLRLDAGWPRALGVHPPEARPQHPSPTGARLASFVQRGRRPHRLPADGTAGGQRRGLGRAESIPARLGIPPRPATRCSSRPASSSALLPVGSCRLPGRAAVGRGRRGLRRHRRADRDTARSAAGHRRRGGVALCLQRQRCGSRRPFRR